MSKAADQSTFGDLLRRFRIAAGFSQEELAERATVSLAAVSALERGTRRAPQRQTLKLLLDGLGSSIAVAERTTLLDAAARSRARLPASGAGTRGPMAKQSRVPHYLTTFVARDADIADLRRLTSSYRLVTIVGAGGIGKTRLVCEAASRLGDAFDQVIFADLSSLIDGEMLVPHLAGIAEVRTAASDGLEAIVATFAERPVLLIMDNCEHLLDAVAATVMALLKACPHVVVIATSRERLSVGAEWVHRLSPLGVPNEHALPDEIRSAPAVRLFVRRAQAAEPNFALHEDDLPDVLDICRRLDGIPLAIEIAVARLSSLGIRQLRLRLNQQFAALPGYRDAAVRHQTMNAAIAWSCDLLESPERTLFDRIGVFAGGFTLEAAEIVCSSPELTNPEIVECLTRLVDKSLLLVDHNPSLSRYRPLEPIRLYSLDRLHQSGLFGEMVLRHANWIAERADAANDQVVNSFHQRSISNAMAMELDNVRAALERLLASADDDASVVAARIVGGLRTIWIRLGLPDEGRRWASDVLNKLDLTRYPKLGALVTRLLMQTVQQPVEAQVLAGAINVFKRAGDFYALANLYVDIMLKAGDAGDLELAEMCNREAELLFSSEHGLKDDFYARYCSARALLQAFQGRFEEARAEDEVAAAEIEARGSLIGHGRRCEARSYIEALAGNYSDAITWQREALAAIADEGPMYVEQMHVNFATYSLLKGDFADADHAIRMALEGGRLHHSIFTEIVQVAAAAQAHHGSPKVAAHLKGFYDERVTARKGSFRTALEIQLNERFDTAISGRSDEAGIASARASGAKMSAAAVRELILSSKEES